MKRIIILALLASTITACGGIDNAQDAPPCTKLLAVGAKAPSTEAPYSAWVCRDAKGELMAPASAYYACPDGSQMNYNEYGWWRSTDRVVHAGKPMMDCSTP